MLQQNYVGNESYTKLKETEMSAIRQSEEAATSCIFTLKATGTCLCLFFSSNNDFSSCCIWPETWPANLVLWSVVLDFCFNFRSRLLRQCLSQVPVVFMGIKRRCFASVWAYRDLWSTFKWTNNFSIESQEENKQITFWGYLYFLSF